MHRTPRLVEWSEASVAGHPGHRLMIVLAAPGCAWHRQAGGCWNCAFPSSLGTGTPVSTDEYRAQLADALLRLPADARPPVHVDLYASGSYLNPDEVPEEAQQALLARAAAEPSVTRLTVETRPEYATRERVERLRRAAGGKLLEVAIGLETADDRLRDERVHKGFAWADFARAAEALAAAGASLLAYVLLKPLDTPEAEALEDAVRSAGRVFGLGAALGLPTRVALEPCFVAPGTKLSREFEAGRYRPPWLWSAVEVVERVAPLGEVHVGLSDEGLEPARAARNCERCTSRVRAALAEFNRSQDLVALAGLTCACQAEWRGERA
jgi:archaeosine synthase beta-subunit